MAGRIRTGLLIAIGVLYLASIPWYRTPGAMPEIWLGLPSWVTVAIGCYVLAAVLNAIAWSLTEIDDDAPDDEVGLPEGESSKRPPGDA